MFSHNIVYYCFELKIIFLHRFWSSQIAWFAPPPLYKWLTQHRRGLCNFLVLLIGSRGFQRAKVGPASWGLFAEFCVHYFSFLWTPYETPSFFLGVEKVWITGLRVVRKGGRDPQVWQQLYVADPGYLEGVKSKAKALQRNGLLLHIQPNIGDFHFCAVGVPL